MTAFGALMGLLLLSGATGGVNPTTVPQASANPAFSVTLTGYNAVPGQTDADPLVTANGGVANPAVVAARSRDLADQLPFGTVIAITRDAANDPNCGYTTVAPLVGYRVITDTMNSRIKSHVDVLFGNDASVSTKKGLVNASRILGSCDDTTITVVGHLDLTHVSDLPETQAQLAALVKKSGLALK